MSDRHDISMKMQIIDNALQLFKLYDYERVTVQEICESCNLTRGAFYYHFRSKDEILDYCYLGVDSIDIERILLNEAGLNPLEQFFLVFELYLGRTIDVGYRLFSQIVIRNIERNSPQFSPQYISQRQVYIKLLSKAQYQGLFENAAPLSELVDSIVYLANGIAVIWCNSKGELDMLAEHRKMLNALLQPCHITLDLDAVSNARIKQAT